MEKEGGIYCHPEKVESPSEKSFTIIWEIQNAKYFFNAGFKLQSPVIFVDVLERTGWRLVLHRLKPYEWTYMTIKREAVDDGPEKFDLHYHFDTNLRKDEALKLIRSHTFRKDESGPATLLYKGRSTTGSLQTTIRCIMRKNDGPISMSGQCIARTRIGGEDFQFVGKVENYSSLTPGSKRTLKVSSSSAHEKFMTVDLRIRDTILCSVFLDIIPIVEKSEYSYTFSSTILDFSGKETDIQKCCTYTLQKVEKLLLCHTSTILEDSADFYLANDTLSLLCKITVNTGIKFEKVENVEYGTVSTEDLNQKGASFSDLKTPILAGTSSAHDDNPKFLDRSSIVSECKNSLTNPFPNILDDFIAFYKQGILCDAKLQTATETFPVHKTILSARSPVFEVVFTSNMKEKIGDSVRINDLDAETVKRMLLFLYSDSLEELEWREAKKLYFAADKYQVLLLKQRCATILKRSIDLSNCCELLLLADMHQDEDLKAAVMDYIARDDKEVFLSDQWRDLETSHPLLAINIFRAVHIK